MYTYKKSLSRVTCSRVPMPLLDTTGQEINISNVRDRLPLLKFLFIKLQWIGK